MDSLHFTSLTHSLHSTSRLTFVVSTPYGLPQASTINFCRVDPLRATPSVDDQLVKESTRTEGLSDPAFALRLLSFSFSLISHKISKYCIFFTQKEHPAPQEMKFRHKKQKIVLPMVILEFGYPSPQLHQTLKPIRELFCTTVTI